MQPDSEETNPESDLARDLMSNGYKYRYDKEPDCAQVPHATK